MKAETLERNYPNSVAQIKANERAKVIDEVENGLTKLMIMAEENKSLSFSKGHYDLVFTVLADFLDISETRIEEKWKQVKEQK